MGLLPREVKLLRRDATHLPPSSTQVKNAWGYTSTYPTRLMAWYLINLYLIDGTKYCSVVFILTESLI